MQLYLKTKMRKSMDIRMRLLFGVASIMALIPLSAGAAPMLKVDATSFSAGEIYAGEVVEHHFRISNAGDEPLEVQRVRSS
jgi:hypothetical protein